MTDALIDVNLLEPVVVICGEFIGEVEPLAEVDLVVCVVCWTGTGKNINWFSSEKLQVDSYLTDALIDINLLEPVVVVLGEVEPVAEVDLVVCVVCSTGTGKNI